MNEQEQAELMAHAEELEWAAKSLWRKSKNARLSHSRTHAAGGASAYEIEAVWIRGFLRRCNGEKESAPGHLASGG